MGDEFDNGLSDTTIPSNMGAKSRWIVQGFHDPDITLLNRTVPTPATSDVPLALQMLASIKASAWIADVKSAFTQSIKGQRPDRLFATPPVDGISGEEDDILIEILTEILINIESGGARQEAPCVPPGYPGSLRLRWIVT